LLVSVTAMTAIAGLTLATIIHSTSAKAGGRSAPTADVAATRTPGPGTTRPASPAPPAAPAPSLTPSPSRTPTLSPSRATSAQAAVAQAVGKLDPAGRLSVAVTDAGGGALASYDSGGTAYDTASIVKVDILAALLVREQHTSSGLSARQRQLATSMIESSDNDAANELWGDIGTAPGLAAANRALGLHRTTGGDGYLWGLTQTTADDQIALLRAVFGSGRSPLTAASRAYVSGLMTSVSDGQRWGVSAADSNDAGFALKNGWLQRSATGLWDINSIGEVTYDGHRLLVSVLSSGQRSEQAGIDQVERVAHAVAKAYTGQDQDGTGRRLAE